MDYEKLFEVEILINEIMENTPGVDYTTIPYDEERITPLNFED